MNTYTENEIENLMESIPDTTINDLPFLGETEGLNYLKYELRIIFKFITDTTSINDDLKNFIIEEPFKKVPLYINKYPDIVAWRLRIGK